MWMRRGAALATVAVTLAACSGGGEVTQPPEELATSEDVVLDDERGGAVSSLTDVESAVVQIEALGTFWDPYHEEGVYEGPWSGSGFLVAPDGKIVTNNHVVAGAASLSVHLSGEDRTRNARLLGRSECSDLAVIQVDGDELAYVDWYEDDLEAGLEVISAGYPADPDDDSYSLQRGIVSRPATSGATEWSSVSNVIEHDGSIRPGNSGGPLVTEDGRVVGVNYASTEDDRSFAIGRDEAQPVLDRLAQGEDVHSIGVVPVVVYDDEDIPLGVWVEAVQTGSPADDVGIEPGDIITRLENIQVGFDGDLEDYCDVLRSRDGDDPLQVEVLRGATGEILTGRLNTDDELEPVERIGSVVAEDEGELGGESTYDSYVRASDDTGSMVMEIPSVWSDIDGSPWMQDGRQIGLQITAAPDIDEFLDFWGTPGVMFSVSREVAATMDETAFLDAVDFEDCDYAGREDYEDPAYTGVYDLYTGCGGTDAMYLVLAAVPESRSYLIVLEAEIATDADLDALDRILGSFFVTDESAL